MKKKITVLLAGIPIVSLPVGFMGTGGKKASKYISNSKILAEKTVKGATDWIRKPLEKKIKASGELLLRDIEVEVVDFGEIIIDNTHRTQSGFNESETIKFSKEFAKKTKEYDLTLVVGGDHTGGIFLYGIEGLIIRFDEHSDGCSNHLKCEKSSIQRNNYVCAAIRNNLKKEIEIAGIGIREGEANYQFNTENNGFEKVNENNFIFDLDLDVFSQKYNLKTDYSKGTMAPSDFIGYIRKYSPNTLGFFEITQNDKLAANYIFEFCIQAIIQIGKKRKGIKIVKKE